MLRSLVIGAISVLLAAAMPALVLPMPQPEPADDRLLLIETINTENSSTNKIRLLTSGKILELPIEEYLVGVLISEMPLSFHVEALKAQTVAARTFAVKQQSMGKHHGFDLCDQSSCCQAWSSMDTLRNKLGDSFSACVEKACNAVDETEGQLMRYNGSLIDAVYFSCSGGMTEAAVAVWGSDVPYLQSVDSPGEETASKYDSVAFFSADEFRACMERQDLTGDPETWFGGEKRSEGGGILEMEIGGRLYSGLELRSKLGLNSTLFSIGVEGNEIVISVQGYGHRVGMSQYGANAMAEKGHDYTEILTYYYQGVEIG